ncbi:MAG: phosphomannomutase/phosphoglucomutase, partial [Bacteroidota bacterium]|nr:phosphomannomutase/phosphoglucomutase [Bacteroidota bacterium]
MKAFKAYDIRGVYNKDFNAKDVYKIGFFLPKLLNTDKILVGRDARESSPEIFESLCKGITDSGASVYNAELCTTPMVYWATAKYSFKASVVITASHNPKEYNGMKISREKALPVGFDSGLKELKEMVETLEIVPSQTKGIIKKFDFIEEYIKFQKGYLTNISNLNLSIDLSNGMSALLIKDIIGETPHYIFDDLDCTFPNHEANPLVPENVKDIQNAVIKNKSDLGIIFDGDADRVMFIDEKGKFISPDLIIAL